MTACNLLHEPWLPCLMCDGSERDLSLLEVLAQAPLVREIHDPSPLVTVSLHRLLLTILHRVVGPPDATAWQGLWRAAWLSHEALQEYLLAWSDRFHLFHPTRPFYQAPGLPAHLSAPVARLTPELSSGNQPTVFDHHVDEQAAAVPAATAARWLVAHQNFCLSGCCGDGRRLASVRSGPLAHAALFMACGRNLCETLLLNLVPYDPAAAMPLATTGEEDLPAWEQELPSEPSVRPPRGYLDYLTWQSRRVLLEPVATPDGVMARSVIVMPGMELPSGLPVPDPMTAQHPAKGAAMRMEPERACWRHSLAIFANRRFGYARPLNVRFIAEQSRYGVLPAECCYGLSVFGLGGARARVDSWHHQRQTVPVPYLNDDDLAADLERALGLAEEIGQTLQAALWQAAQAQAFGRPGARSAQALKQMAGGDPDALAYWTHLESPVRLLVQRLPGELEHRDGVIRWWLATCERAAWETLDRALRGLLGRPTGLKPAVLARDALYRDLGRIAAPWRREVCSEAI